MKNQSDEARELRNQLRKAHAQACGVSKLHKELAEARSQLAEANRQNLTLKLQWENSQVKLREYEQLLVDWKHPQPVQAYDRQLQMIKSIYTDRYNELFRLTTAQITELERQLAQYRPSAAFKKQISTQRPDKTQKQLAEVNSHLQEILQSEECTLTKQLQGLAELVQTMQPAANETTRRTPSSGSVCTFVPSRDSEDAGAFSATAALEAYLSKHA